MTTDDSVRQLLVDWAAAVEAGDLEGVIAAHAEDIVMYDVPLPVQNIGIDVYRDSWPQFFAYLDGGEFRWQELHVVAGAEVAFGYGIIGCKPSSGERFPVRLTVGLRRRSGGWVIQNEHHSVPST